MVIRTNQSSGRSTAADLGVRQGGEIRGEIVELNIGNSIFQGLNDKHGLMICGYEWGFSKEDQKRDDSGGEIFYDENAITTFSNKSPAYGDMAFNWRYDNRIVRWFEIWGHPLSRNDQGDDFEKCIIQTNWCNTEGNKIKENYYQKLTDTIQIENFIYHIRTFEPLLIFFMGSQMIDILQDKKVLDKFVQIMGEPKGAPKKYKNRLKGEGLK